MAKKSAIGSLTVTLGSKGTSATSGKTTSAEYRNKLAKEDFPKLDGITTLHESFQHR
jgi:hypothetical protein